MSTQRPIAIPEPTSDVEGLYSTAKALKEAVEVLEGVRGNRAAMTESEVRTLIENILIDNGLI